MLEDILTAVPALDLTQLSDKYYELLVKQPHELEILLDDDRFKSNLSLLQRLLTIATKFNQTDSITLLENRLLWFAE